MIGEGECKHYQSRKTCLKWLAYDERWRARPGRWLKQRSVWLRANESPAHAHIISDLDRSRDAVKGECELVVIRATCLPLVVYIHQEPESFEREKRA